MPHGHQNKTYATSTFNSVPNKTEKEHLLFHKYSLTSTKYVSLQPLQDTGNTTKCLGKHCHVGLIFIQVGDVGTNHLHARLLAAAMVMRPQQMPHIFEQGWASIRVINCDLIAGLSELCTTTLIQGEISLHKSVHLCAIQTDTGCC